MPQTSEIVRNSHKGEFNHIIVGSNDIERSKHFYDAVLGTLGAGEPMCNKADRTPTNGGTISFKCKSPKQVREFHDTAVARGGSSIEDAPGLRDSNLGLMHLAYVCEIPIAVSSVPSTNPYDLSA